MKSERPKRSVADMDVLQDIRGLLSTAQKGKPSIEPELREKARLDAEIARYEEELERYRGLVQKQQEEMERLRKENEQLVTNLSLLHSNKAEVPPSPNAEAEALNREIAELKAQKYELSSGLCELEELLQLKLRELLKRIASVLQEIGAGEVAIEFRRAMDSLEDVENCAYFLRELLKEG